MCDGTGKKNDKSQPRCFSIILFSLRFGFELKCVTEINDVLQYDYCFDSLGLTYYSINLFNHI